MTKFNVGRIKYERVTIVTTLQRYRHNLNYDNCKSNFLLFFLSNVIFD